MTVSPEVLYFLSGSTALGIIAHAVNTFPTPKNPYGMWLLGITKYIVGQRTSGANALQGLQTEVTAVTTEQKNALNNGSKMEVIKPGAIVTVVPVETVVVPKDESAVKSTIQAEHKSGE